MRGTATNIIRTGQKDHIEQDAMVTVAADDDDEGDDDAVLEELNHDKGDLKPAAFPR